MNSSTSQTESDSTSQKIYEARFDPTFILYKIGRNFARKTSFNLKKHPYRNVGLITRRALLKVINRRRRTWGRT